MTKRKYLYYLFPLLGLLLHISCSGSDSRPVDLTGDIVGFVVDARTSEPLYGVGLTLSPSGKSATTGSDGRYEFVDVTAGNYIVQAKKNDYITDSKSVTVNVGQKSPLDFRLTPSIPKLEVSQNELDFGVDNTTLSIDLFNKGHAVLNWQISEDVAWLFSSPTSGKIQTGEQSAIVIHVNRDGLDRGNYSQTFTITSNGGSKDIRVNMSVQGIAFNVSPGSLDFGPTTTVLPLTLKNMASSAVAYTLSTSNAWIKLSHKSGAVSPSSSEQITVSVDRTGMSEGDYSGEITLAANGQQQGIPVRMNIPSKAKPTIYLSSVTDVTYADAVFNAAIVAVGSSQVTRHGFCWSTSEYPTVENAQLCNFGDCTAAKEFSHKALALEQATTYYVRAYAENREGISYSNQEKFVTSGIPSVPAVETGAVSNIQSAQAEVSGVLTHMGNLESVTQYGHVWSTKGNPTTNDHKTAFGTTWSTGSFTSTLTELKPNVTYHVRAYATNEKGTAYGEDVEFTTDYADVTLITDEAMDVTSKSAKVSGNVSDKGGHKILEQGICWSLSPSPSLSDFSVPASSNGDDFEVTLAGLSAETRYYACAYAKTERGDEFYGNVISFTTPSKEVNINVGGYEDEEFWEK